MELATTELQHKNRRKIRHLTLSVSVFPSPQRVYQSAPKPLPAVVRALVLMASDPADIEVAEPPVSERSHLPTQDAPFSKYDILQTDKLPYFIPTDGSHRSADTTREIRFTYLLFLILISLLAQKFNLLMQFYFILMISDQDSHLGIIKKKPIKTKYRLKCAFFRLVSQLFW